MTWPLDAYLAEGPRETEWFTPGVIKQHRMLATTLNALIGEGFALAHVKEFGPDDTQIAEHPEWVNYDLPPDLIGKAWGGRFRGQKQKWFAYRFFGQDSEISIVPPAGHQAEFVAWKWAPVSDLLDLIVPFKRDVYREVLKNFAELARRQSP